MQGTRRGLERFGGPVKTGRARGLGGRVTWTWRPPPALCNPSGKKRKEGASKSFLPGSASSALPRTLSGVTQAALVSRTASRASKTAEPRPQEPLGCGLGRPLPPACPGADAGTARIGQRRTRPGTDGRPLARAWRRGAAQPPRPQQLPADAGYLSVRPGVGRPQDSAWWGFGDSVTSTFQAPAPAPARRAATTHPTSTPADGAPRGRALGRGAADRPPRLPPGARVSPPSHSPPQLSVLCSLAGNDLRKRLGQGLRQAARARR